MQQYTQQRQDNPPSPSSESWLNQLPEYIHATLVARAFMLFGATKPIASQWEAVRQSLQEPTYCN